ncbi:hypothetical protein EDD39_5247 [Kitasatospora cineracea]|uniref:DDE family transposase n=1 Tax=Kitasatospora cineracea TaxID=88074 RepID=A0A8G1UMQ1_9ACTN|nr:hypothetical protein EDD39_5247 [Kitasatospora cineracea]
MPSAGLRPDRGAGRRQPAVHPRHSEGPGPQACGPSPHPARRGRRDEAVIPEKADQAANRKKKGSAGGRPVGHDAGFYKDRNTGERLIDKLKAWRGIATRYDKKPESYLAGLQLRGAMIWIKDLTRTTP